MHQRDRWANPERPPTTYVYKVSRGEKRIFFSVSIPRAWLTEAEAARIDSAPGKVAKLLAEIITTGFGTTANAEGDGRQRGERTARTEEHGAPPSDLPF